MGLACSTVQTRKKRHTITSIRHTKERAATVSAANINNIYDFDPVPIGIGSFGVIRKATLKGTKGPIVAIKTVQINDDIRRADLRALRDLDHPNIIKFHELYESGKNLYAVMEYCSGGEVTARHVKDGKFTEPQAAHFAQCAFSAIKYIHERGYAHRDIKPENFLYSNEGADAEIKLADFGLACFIGLDAKANSLAGTPIYIAPEVLKGFYDTKCDEWSIGVTLFTLLCGEPPFDAPNTVELSRKILENPVDFNINKVWQDISEDAKDLVGKLLDKNPETRISVMECLKHPWLKMAHKRHLDSNTTKNIIQNLKNFHSTTKLRKEVLAVLVSLIDKEDLKPLVQAFKYFDKHDHGEIDADSLRQVIKEQGLSQKDANIDEILKDLKSQESKAIDFSSFLGASIDIRFQFTDDLLLSAFKHFDVDNCGYITANSLKEAMNRSAKFVTMKEVNEMIQEVDHTKDGKIDFDAFKALIISEEDYKPTQEERPDHRSSIAKPRVAKPTKLNPESLILLTE